MAWVLFYLVYTKPPTAQTRIYYSAPMPTLPFCPYVATHLAFCMARYI